MGRVVAETIDAKVGEPLFALRQHVKVFENFETLDHDIIAVSDDLLPR
jgi:hypothetical protein